MNPSAAKVSPKAEGWLRAPATKGACGANWRPRCLDPRGGSGRGCLKGRAGGETRDSSRWRTGACAGRPCPRSRLTALSRDQTPYSACAGRRLQPPIRISMVHVMLLSIHDRKTYPEAEERTVYNLRRNYALGFGIKGKAP